MAGERSGTAGTPHRIPPGQRRVSGWPVSHYGPVPRFCPERWNLRVHGTTATGAEHSWTFDELSGLPYATVTADLHCATGPTSTGHEWYGIPATAVVDLVPPAPEVTHVMAWAEYGYAANLRLADFTAPETLLATHHNGEHLTAEHGFPLRLVVPHLYGYKSPSGCAPSSTSPRTGAASGRNAATTTSATPGKNSATPTRNTSNRIALSTPGRGRLHPLTPLRSGAGAVGPPGPVRSMAR